MNPAGADSARGLEDEFLLACLHDIRQHLRKSILGAQMMERQSADALPPGLRKHLDEILAAGREMDHLLTRLAQFAVAGSPVNDKPRGDVAVMFDSALRRLASKNTNAQISADAIRACGVHAPYSFETVVGELLDNALKFRHGPVTINILYEPSPERHVFGVRDNGIGFDSRYGEKILRPLERLHPLGAYAGCGLGLAICRRLVEAWGGSLWAESAQGKGATFWFSLPK